MAHVEPVDLETIDSDDKENTYQHNNALPRVSCTEKGYEELDVSELNMKLRYSMTPTPSPMSKSFTANCFDNRNIPVEDVLMTNSQNLTRSLNSTMTNSDSLLKSPKSLPLQSLSTDQLTELNRNSSIRSVKNNITVTISSQQDIDDNQSLPSTSSSLTHTPEATTPTKEIPKQDGGSPIMRGLKSVFSMFMSSQSLIPPNNETNVEKNNVSPSELQVKDTKPQTILVSTPIKSKNSPLKNGSPLKESIVFKDDLERELQWNDDLTIVLKEENIPAHKLSLPPLASKSVDNLMKDNINTTVEYMDISLDESAVYEPEKIIVMNSKASFNAESDSEFQDCETTLTKTEQDAKENKIGNTNKSLTNNCSLDNIINRSFVENEYNEVKFGQPIVPSQPLVEFNVNQTIDEDNIAKIQSIAGVKLDKTINILTDFNVSNEILPDIVEKNTQSNNVTQIISEEEILLKVPYDKTEETIYTTEVNVKRYKCEQPYAENQTVILNDFTENGDTITDLNELHPAQSINNISKSYTGCIQDDLNMSIVENEYNEVKLNQSPVPLPPQSKSNVNQSIDIQILEDNIAHNQSISGEKLDESINIETDFKLCNEILSDIFENTKNEDMIDDDDLTVVAKEAILLKVPDNKANETINITELDVENNKYEEPLVKNQNAILYMGNEISGDANSEINELDSTEYNIDQTMEKIDNLCDFQKEVLSNHVALENTMDLDQANKLENDPDVVKEAILLNVSDNKANETINITELDVENNKYEEPLAKNQNATLNMGNEISGDANSEINALHNTEYNIDQTMEKINNMCDFQNEALSNHVALDNTIDLDQANNLENDPDAINQTIHKVDDKNEVSVKEVKKEDIISAPNLNSDCQTNPSIDNIMHKKSTQEDVNVSVKWDALLNDSQSKQILNSSKILCSNTELIKNNVDFSVTGDCDSQEDIKLNFSLTLGVNTLMDKHNNLNETEIMSPVHAAESKLFDVKNVNLNIMENYTTQSNMITNVVNSKVSDIALPSDNGAIPSINNDITSIIEEENKNEIIGTNSIKDSARSFDTLPVQQTTVLTKDERDLSEEKNDQCVKQNSVDNSFIVKSVAATEEIISTNSIKDCARSFDTLPVQQTTVLTKDEGDLSEEKNDQCVKQNSVDNTFIVKSVAATEEAISITESDNFNCEGKSINHMVKDYTANDPNNMEVILETRQSDISMENGNDVVLHNSDNGFNQPIMEECLQNNLANNFDATTINLANRVSIINSPFQDQIHKDLIETAKNNSETLLDKEVDNINECNKLKEENSLETQSKIGPTPSSPVIISKGYNFNFDEYDEPFATKTKIRQSPPLESPRGDTSKPISEGKSKTFKKTNQNRRKSQPVPRNQSVSKKPFNSSFDSSVTLKEEKNKDIISQPSFNNLRKNANITNNRNNDVDIHESVMARDMQELDVNKNKTDICNEEEIQLNDNDKELCNINDSTRIEISRKNVFNLPEIDGTNFNPFATRSKICISPTPANTSTEYDETANLDICNNTVNIICNKEEVNSSEISNITIFSKHNDEKNDTVKEINTEDEDTIEGPFLEAEDFVQHFDKDADIIPKTVNDDMIGFDDFPNQTNDDNAEIFIDAEAIEFLLNQNINNVVADSGKESLFLKFDPLFAKRVSSDGIHAGLNEVPKRESTPKKTIQKVDDNLLTDFDAGPSSKFVLFSDLSEDINVNVSKPTMIVNPAVNSIVSPRRAATPPRVNRQSLTFTSPAMAVIDKLLSLSGNGNSSFLSHDVTMPEISAEQHQSDFIQLREMLAEKELHVQSLRSESMKLKDRLADMEAQVRSLESESQDRLRKITDLNEQSSKKTKINKAMAAVVEECERTIACLVAELDQDKRRNAEERMKLIRDRDEQAAHLASMEASYSDLNRKYEKSKQTIFSLKANEDIYKKSVKEFQDTLIKMQNNYESLKQHATSKLNYANLELEKINRAHESEILKLNAMIKRKDLHITSLEETLAQKTKANEELTAICDELINKVG